MSATAVAVRPGRKGGEKRGNNKDRRRRKEYLVQAYRADVDILLDLPLIMVAGEACEAIETVPLGEGQPCCRCYRCGELLTVETVTVDRIIPGCAGGSYRRNNIRPSCQRCAHQTGGFIAAARRSA